MKHKWVQTDLGLCRDLMVCSECGLEKYPEVTLPFGCPNQNQEFAPNERKVMNKFKLFMAIVGIIFLVSALMFGTTWIGIEWRGFFGPKRAAVEREIFRETRSYNEGKIQQLAKYRLEYLQADASGKQAIASTVRMMFADYDKEQLPTELRSFYTDMTK